MLIFLWKFWGVPCDLPPHLRAVRLFFPGILSALRKALSIKQPHFPLPTTDVWRTLLNDCRTRHLSTALAPGGEAQLCLFETVDAGLFL